MSKGKIVHICLCGTFTDGLNYQENILTKYHRIIGYDVTVVTSEWEQDENGNLVKKKKKKYVNENDVKIIRLESVIGNAYNRFKVFPKLIKILNKEEPNILFIHDCQFLDLFRISRYLKRNTSVTTYIDNHVDEYNGASNWLSKNILHRIIWGNIVRDISKRVAMFYGVTPARVEFLIKMYRLPKSKCSLLLMGADDALVNKSVKKRKETRKKCGIKENDFLIVTGGKINQYRLETINLMEAVKKIDDDNLKLIVFGTVSDVIKAKFDALCEDDHIIYIGWVDSCDTYEYLAAGELVAFPGLHSVMWEQAVALGIPCLFKDIDGFHHVDLGGNARFLKTSSVQEIINVVASIYSNEDVYNMMSIKAKSENRNRFLYSSIARDCLRS